MMHVQVDDALLSQAIAAIGAESGQAAVEQGLRKLIRIREQLDAIEALRGIGWDGDLDDMRTSKYIAAE